MEFCFPALTAILALESHRAILDNDEGVFHFVLEDSDAETVSPPSFCVVNASPKHLRTVHNHTVRFWTLATTVLILRFSWQEQWTVWTCSNTTCSRILCNAAVATQATYRVWTVSTCVCQPEPFCHMFRHNTSPHSNDVDNSIAPVVPCLVVALVVELCSASMTHYLYCS